ncbi:DMT family transporter [Chromohalobacter israelensis]|uniref:EamA domain-containing protein n=1 Tax=Chromohalobacter israelensis (strain ATCC BAA-138 / DSM 3043 / CIP 106854 / NCIMB 13768 / 1H11) TaxID=290398 RepID=Q1QZK2_CHRI1|nr:DMT family transporter [Chromohalobacter salexigens]ABE58106.1 protein of unknown function DUF6, transmembrane [Chromohalobacter salexigens DSM 3043]
MQKTKWVYTFLAVAVLAISTTAPLVKLADATAPVIACYRMLFATCLVAFLVLFGRDSLLKIDGKRLAYCAVAGFLLGLHFITWFSSLDYTSVASSVTLATMQPLFAFIIGYFLYHERLNRGAALGAMVSVLGGIIIGWGDYRVSGVALWGNLLALSAAFLATVYFFVGQHALKSVSLNVYTFYCYGFAAIAIALYCLVTGNALSAVNRDDLLIFFLLALLPTLLGHSVLNYCTRFISVSLVSMAMLCEPVGASVLAWLLLGTLPTVTQLVGGALTVLGVLYFLRKRSN